MNDKLNLPGSSLAGFLSFYVITKTLYRGYIRLISAYPISVNPRQYWVYKM
ncbi:hypothetical protein [Paenibacillus sp. RC67]|uniref:hypothetical protein n=1 Tax=Paenibacillus sp. RC67 TaxID=3039392 RepID=UPI0024AE4944|nr:hypothetical protein [Paenibacillus sp. RC67]